MTRRWPEPRRGLSRAHERRFGRLRRRVRRGPAAAVAADLPGVRVERCVHQLHGPHRVGPDQDLGVRVLGELVNDPPQAERRNHAVGDHGPAHAECAGDTELRLVRDGDGPGAGRDLLGPQLRSHRGLAMRRQVDPACRAPVRQHGLVAVQRRARQREKRSRQLGEPRPSRARTSPTVIPHTDGGMPLCRQSTCSSDRAAAAD